MDSQLHSEIRQLAEQYCPTKEPYAITAWKAGFHAFAELVDNLHKQNSVTQHAWLEANTRPTAYMSSLDQAIADHQEISEAAALQSMKLSIAEHRAGHYQNQAELLRDKTESSIWQDRFGSWHGRG